MTDTEKDYSVESENIETPSVDDSQQEAEPEQPELIDKKRHKEILHGKEQEVQKARETAYELALKQVSQNASTLLDVHELDPKLAAKVAENFDWAQTEWWSYQNFLWDKKQSKAFDFDTEYKKRRQQEIHEESLKKASKFLDKLPDEVREEAQNYFSDITDGKVLDEEKALKYAEMASVYVQKDKVQTVKKKEAEKALSSTWLPKWNTSWDAAPYWDIVNGRFQLIYPDNNKQ